MSRDATGDPRYPFPKVPSHFFSPRSPVLYLLPRPCHCSPSSPEKQLFWQFSWSFKFFYKKNYIWLFLILILSIFRNFVISNHENHNVWFVYYRYYLNRRFCTYEIKCKFFSIKIIFKLTSNLKQILPEIPPNPKLETNRIGFSFPNPQGMTNCHSQNPRGTKTTGGLASLFMSCLSRVSIDLITYQPGRKQMVQS